MTNDLDILNQIQNLQFKDKNRSEALLASFISDTFGLDVATVELRPLAVSLNSFNGFLTLTDGRHLFFKTHTEADNVIGEYYNATRLADAGYPIIKPILSSTEAGKQFLIYEVITAPSVFDIAWNIECGEPDLFPALTVAQNNADDELLALYTQTLAFQSVEEAVQSPIHQLFYHRLVGGRLARFYGSTNESAIALPGEPVDMQHVRRVRWNINGQEYHENLDSVIDNAIRLLNPAQAGPSVIGHGDAHNGNVFLQMDSDPPSVLYFDPAFAGRHNPILDLVKPLFHNVFAMWMYFPEVKTEQTFISFQSSGDCFNVEYAYELPQVRLMFLRSKVDRVLIPILQALKDQQQLRPDWRAYLKAALFCCPFLTMNLADSNKFTPAISLLGLAMSVEMGAESAGKRSLIDQLLDEVTDTLV